MAQELQPYPVYKPSRLSWLGMIPAHWKDQRAKYLFREIDERSTTGDEELLSVSHITGVTPRRQKNVTMFKAESYVSSKLCQSGDLVVNTMWAWMAALGVARETGIVSPSYHVYRPTMRNVLDPDFVDYLLRTQPYASEYSCRSTGIRSSRLRLYPEEFLEIPIIRPPLEEQERIASYLKAKDQLTRRLIRNKRRLIDLLNEQKQGVIHRAVTRGLDPSVPLKPSGIPWLGDIPQHWECTAVWQLFEIGRGKVTSHQYIGDHPGPYPLFSSQTENDGVMGRIDSYLFDGDYLTWTTDGAHAGTVFRRSGKFSCTNVCGTLKSKRHLDLDFMQMSVASETKRHVRIDINPKLMNNMMARIRVVVPGYEEQVEIATYVRQAVMPGERAISRLEREVELLREYRTRLVADVVTGKLDVRGAEILGEPGLSDEPDPIVEDEVEPHLPADWFPEDNNE